MLVTEHGGWLPPLLRRVGANLAECMSVGFPIESRPDVCVQGRGQIALDFEVDPTKSWISAAADPLDSFAEGFHVSEKADPLAAGKVSQSFGSRDVGEQEAVAGQELGSTDDGCS